MSDFIYQCIVCDKQTVSAKAAEIEDAACCMTCAESHNGPGKFEQYSAREPEDFRKYCAEAMGKALILYTWSLDSSWDDYMWQEGWGTVIQFGLYVLQEDDRGFVTFEEFDSAEKLQKQWDEWYSNGWGASEDDYYVQHDYHTGWEVYVAGKKIHLYPSPTEEAVTRRRALAAVSLEMRRSGFYGSVWETGERGDIREISKEVW